MNINIGEIMASNSKRVFNLYIDDSIHSLYPNTPKPVRVWQIVFNGDCDMFMRRDRETFYKFSYEGINYLGEHIFDQIPEKKQKSCCLSYKRRMRHRVLFTARARELFATHIDTITGHREQYVVDR